MLHWLVSKYFQPFMALDTMVGLDTDDVFSSKVKLFKNVVHRPPPLAAPKMWLKIKMYLKKYKKNAK